MWANEPVPAKENEPEPKRARTNEEEPVIGEGQALENEEEQVKASEREPAWQRGR